MHVDKKLIHFEYMHGRDLTRSDLANWFFWQTVAWTVAASGTAEEWTHFKTINRAHWYIKRRCTTVTEGLVR